MKNVILFSGGNDSAKLLEFIENPILVCINYGQKSWRWEYEAARKIAREYMYRVHTLDLRSVFIDSSNPLITGRHAETIEETVVPFRNALLISAVASWSLDKFKDEPAQLFIGVHKSTIEDMNDCSASFIQSMNETLRIGTGGRCTLVAPFVDKLKKDILCSPNIRFMTYTCYEGVPGGCGRCIACTTMRKFL